MIGGEKNPGIFIFLADRFEKIVKENLEKEDKNNLCNLTPKSTKH